MTSKLDIMLAWSNVKFAIDTAHRAILYWPRLTDRSSADVRLAFTQKAESACREMARRCRVLADLLGDTVEPAPRPCETLRQRVLAANEAEAVLFDCYNGCSARQTAVEYEALANEFASLVCAKQKSA